MSFLGTFNAEENEDEGNPVLSKGEYTAEIINSDLKDSKSGGKYVELHYRIHAQGEPVVVDRLNIQNSNPTAERIGKGKLSKVVKACHKVAITDTEELHGIPIKVKLGIEEGGMYPDRNNVLDVMAVGPAPMASSAPAATQSAPWKK